MARLLVALTALLVLTFPSRAQAPLAPVADAEGSAVRAQVRRLLPMLRKGGGPLSGSELKSLAHLLSSAQEDSPRAFRELQTLLDEHCLVGVAINPESRVKAVRGPGRALLREGQQALALIRIENEAGVTAPLRISSREMTPWDGSSSGGWLEVRLRGMTALSGGKLDYAVVEMRAQQAGKREATLQFDVGQGTQDLGFRAEIPILFTIEPARASPR